MSAATVEEYLAALPEDRRATVEAVCAVVRENLDPAYEEGMQYGMIAWYVPLSTYPKGYHVDPKQPVTFAAIASNKSGISLHLLGMYDGPGNTPEGQTDLTSWFREAWTAAGKKLDMGKSCVRFKRLDGVPLDVVAEAIRRQPAAAFIARYEAGAAARRR